LEEGPNAKNEKMRRNGWVEYDHSNPLHYKVQYADPMADDTYHTCWWFQLDISQDQTWIDEADGPH